MKKHILIIFCLLFSFGGISQTECDYKVSFYLKTKKEKIIKKIYRKQVDKGSYLYKYFTKKNKHYFSLGKINDCSYELTIKKRGKKLKLVFHNTREKSSFVDFGTLPMKDTTIHFYDGLRYKPTIPVNFPIMDEMPRMVIMPKKELPVEVDSINSFMLPSYGGFKNVKVEFVKNRLGIDPLANGLAYKITKPFGFIVKKEFDIYELSETTIEKLTDHNEHYSTKLKLGRVYQLTFTEMNPERDTVIAFFGGFQVVKHNYVSQETVGNFARILSYSIMKTKNGVVGAYSILCPSNNLLDTYKIIFESGLFKLIEPSFLNSSKNVKRNGRNLNKTISPFFESNKPTIDSVEFYSKIMNDLPDLALPVFSSYVITRNGMYYGYRKSALRDDVKSKVKIKLSNSLFKEAQFMLTQLPFNYIDSVGNYGDCLVNLNQSSNYNCFSMIIYKSDGTNIVLQGNELPRDLYSYYFKAYRFNEKLRK